MGQAEAPPYEEAAPEQALDLLGPGIGDDIEILRLLVEKEVADATAHQESVVSVALQALKDVKDIPLDMLPGHGMTGLGHYYGILFTE